jgi:signal transduction histidine kinase
MLSLIGWRMLIVSLVFTGLMIAWTNSSIEDAADSLRKQAVVAKARELATRLELDEAGRLRLALDPEAAAAVVPHYAVVDAAGRVVASSQTPAALLSVALPRPPAMVPGAIDESAMVVDQPQPVFFHAGEGGGATGVSLPVMVGGLPATVQAAEDRSQRENLLDDLVREFFGSVGWLVIPGLALLLMVNLLTVAAELRPLRAASALAASIGPKATGVRLPEDGLPKEIFPLFRAVNQALDRLDRGFRAQREFTADAAHELRTPLAVLKAHVESLPDRATALALAKDVDAMTRVVNQLLRIAQLETLTIGRDERADLHAIAVDVARLLAPLAVASDRLIAVSGADEAVPVWGNADALGQAVRNLAENALAHTPAHSTVELEVVEESPSIRVIDRGPGIPPAQRAQVFRRFWRAQPRRGAGAGLGLAIVARIADAHGGAVEIADAPGGGAVFILRLRADPPAGDDTTAKASDKRPRQEKAPAAAAAGA